MKFFTGFMRRLAFLIRAPEYRQALEGVLDAADLRPAAVESGVWSVKSGVWSYGIPFGDDFKIVAERHRNSTLHSPNSKLIAISPQRREKRNVGGLILLFHRK